MSKENYSPEEKRKERRKERRKRKEDSKEFLCANKGEGQEAKIDP